MSELRRRLVTHKDCMDGSCCAIVFLTIFPDAEVVYVNPHEVDSFPGRGDGTMTVFADVCPSNFLVDENVVDHHIGNIEKIRGKEPDDAVLDTGSCGCKLLFEKLLDLVSSAQLRKNLELLTGLADDYDRWVLQKPDSKVLASLHQIVGQEWFVADFLWRVQHEFWDDRWPILRAEDRTLVLHFDRMTKRYADRCVQSSWTCHTPFGRFVCVFGDARHSNDVCHALLDANPGADYAISLDLLRCSGSIRSRSEEYDCSAIARQFGGNGHKCAAGFPIHHHIMDEVRICFGMD